MRFSKVQSLRVQGCYAVGWSDLHFLQLSKIGTRRAHTALCAYFPFQKITGTLKIIFSFKVCRNLPFTSKNNCQRENSKLEFV